MNIENEKYCEPYGYESIKTKTWIQILREYKLVNNPTFLSFICLKTVSIKYLQ